MDRLTALERKLELLLNNITTSNTISIIEDVLTNRQSSNISKSLSEIYDKFITINSDIINNIEQLSNLIGRCVLYIDAHQNSITLISGVALTGLTKFDLVVNIINKIHPTIDKLLIGQFIELQHSNLVKHPRILNQKSDEIKKIKHLRLLNQKTEKIESEKTNYIAIPDIKIDTITKSNSIVDDINKFCDVVKPTKVNSELILHSRRRSKFNLFH
jgi:hypothetical protein